MQNQIIKDENIFILNTKETTYAFHVLESGHLEHLYYGQKVDFSGFYDAILPKREFVEASAITYSQNHKNLGLENRCLEFSTRGKGDTKEPLVDLRYANGSSTCDFLYESYKIEQKQNLDTLPSAYDDSKASQTLIIKLKDKNYNVYLELCYSVFYDTNVIVRSSKLYNETDEKVKVNRLLSAQLDNDNSLYTLTTFKGAWAREMNKQDSLCTGGIIVNDSKTGISSNRANPFVMLSEQGTSENFGNCYAINLIYSGNHYELAEVNSFGLTHFICGINPFGSAYILNSGEMLESPEAVLTFSNKGYSQISQNMHQFVREHIVRGTWKYKERPVLLNSWEASYFNFNEKKLLNLAKAGSKVGIELFVLDDGWFGQRNDDTSSLGDWDVNTKKLPNGLAGLAEKVNKLGMDFGIWVEPEMLNYDSECYRNNPDFAVEIKGQEHSQGRTQVVMDLTQTKVQDYLIEQMTKVFSSANISYVKWDMNRIVSDAYSSSLTPENQDEFFHRYILGLYRVLKVLTSNFPNILFESCASGGNRFDLGMMCYMPQIWASDNTDAICRAGIQTGCSYGYPMSVIGSHVSASPNHQTLRKTSLDTRFQVACFGLLGYELNLVDLKNSDLEKIKEQINWYKKYRKTLQFGDYNRLINDEHGVYQWITVSKNKEIAVGCYLQSQVIANKSSAIFKTTGLDESKNYHFTNRKLSFDLRDFGDLVNTVAPVHVKQDSLLHNVVAKFITMKSETEDYTVNGGVLNSLGVRLRPGFNGTGYNDDVRFFQDYASRVYMMQALDEE
ncbi:MAG: alpha-galactosidase [Clostridia bacterium]